MFLSKRSNGIYYVHYNRNGKRISVSTKTKFKKQALQFLTHFRDNIHSYIPQTTHYKLSDVIPKILNIVKSDFSISTFQKYFYSLKNFQRLAGDRELELYTPGHCETFKAERLKEVNETSVNIEIRTLKSSFNLCRKLNFTDNNPFEKVRQIKQPEREKSIFTDTEIQILLSNIENELIRNVTIFALHTACRISEICNVKWRDVFFNENYILIRNDYATGFKTKSGKSRKIPMDKGLQGLLKSIQPDNIFNLERFNDYVFKLNGRPTNRIYITKKFKSFVRVCQLSEELTFHSLRHTAITRLIRSGVPVSIVQQIAGHSDVKVTEGYCHLEFSDIQKYFTN